MRYYGSANINRSNRKLIYARDNYMCALCDSTKYLQIHHVVHRGQGGTDNEQNLITLCANCHSLAHGTDLNGCGITPEDVDQACIEYLADYYAPDWNPWAKGRHP